MKRFTIIFDKINNDILDRTNNFFKEVSQIEGVQVDQDTLSVIFESGIERDIIALANKYRIVNFTNVTL